MAFILLRRRRHAAQHPRAAAACLRAFSALPDVDPPATSTRAPTAPTASASTSTRSAVFDLQLAVRAETDPARIHSLVASALSSHYLPRLHTSRPLFSLAASRLARLRRPDLAASLLRLLLASAPASLGIRDSSVVATGKGGSSMVAAGALGIREPSVVATREGGASLAVASGRSMATVNPIGCMTA